MRAEEVTDPFEQWPSSDERVAVQDVLSKVRNWPRLLNTLSEEKPGGGMMAPARGLGDVV